MFKKLMIFFTVLLIFVIGFAGYFVIKDKDIYLSDIYASLGSKAEQNDRPLQAGYYYEKSINFNPQNSSSHLAYAKLNVKLGNLKKAEEELIECTKLTSINAVDGYTALSSFYVEQGRIEDAVNLLNNIPNDLVRAKIGAMRPAAPEFMPAPGRYITDTDVSIAGSDGITCYYSTGESYPCVSTGVWESPLTVSNGTTTIRAVAVSGSGLVSDITEAAYSIDNFSSAVIFKDKTVENMVRVALSRYTGHITTEDMRSITSLSNKTSDGNKIGENITTFSDFQHLKKLEELTLSDLSELPDLTGISVVPSIKSISLENCGIDEASAEKLLSLQGLRVLNLSDNNIRNISFIGKFSNLSYLSLKNNFIGDLTPLLSLSSLSFLDISGNPLENINPIGLLSGLSSLNLSNCSLSDISAVGSLTNLSYIDISGNNISDISALSKCSSLESVIAGQNLISVISPLEKLKNISVLDLRNNKIMNLSPLSRLPMLKTLNISGNYVYDLSPLRDCNMLQTVFAGNNPLISDGAKSVFDNVLIYVD